MKKVRECPWVQNRNISTLDLTHKVQFPILLFAHNWNVGIVGLKA
jgi:hypothetical protein